jgi:hypothetical protein
MMRKFSYLAILIIGILIGLMRLRKQELAAKAEHDESQTNDHWDCPQCHETVPQNFEKCWNCGTHRESGPRSQDAG